MAARGILWEPVRARCPSGSKPHPQHALLCPVHVFSKPFLPQGLCTFSHLTSLQWFFLLLTFVCVHRVSTFTCVLVWMCMYHGMCVIRGEPRCPFSPFTSFETWSFVVFRANRPESLWGRFSCLCLPPFWRSCWDYRGAPLCLALYKFLGFELGSSGLLSECFSLCAVSQGPALISKQHSGPVLEATGSLCFVSLKLFSHHTFNICLLSLSPIPRDSGFSVPRCYLAHGVNTVKPYHVVMDRGSMRGLLGGVHHQARDNENCEVSQTGDSEHQPA